MIRIFALSMVLLLGACAQPPQVQVVNVCPKFVKHDGKFQDALGAEYVKLQPTAKLKQVVSEWINLRDQARVCQQQDGVQP